MPYKYKIQDVIWQKYTDLCDTAHRLNNLSTAITDTISEWFNVLSQCTDIEGQLQSVIQW